MADIATRLRQLRKERDLRQVDLARDLGIAQTTVANYEQHSRFPDEEMLLKLASYFDVSLDYLLGRSDVSIHPGSLSGSLSLLAPPLSSLTQLARQFLDLLLVGRKTEASELILSEARAGTSVRDIYCGTFEPCLRVMGTLWETNEADVSDEHFLTETIEGLMSQLHPYLRRPAARRGGIVLAAVGGEQHVIGIRMVADMLEEGGWDAHLLGGNIPVENILRAVERHQPRALALSATMAPHVETMAHLIRRARERTPKHGAGRLAIIVGGLPFVLDPAISKRIGADGMARNCLETVDLVDSLAKEHGD